MMNLRVRSVTGASACVWTVEGRGRVSVEDAAIDETDET